jgi:acyl-CoA synthetase (AMP-forming)/AMP-acid ligase II
MRLHPPQRVEEYTAQGWWGDAGTWNDAFRRQVAERPDAVAVVDPANLATLTGAEPRRLSWAELGAAVDRFASVLVAHGVGVDDVVAIQLPNSVDLCVAYLAIARIGAVASPLPVQFQRRELTEACGRLDARTLVTVGWFGDREYAVEALALRRHLPELRTLLVTGPDVPEGAVDLAAALAAADPAAVPTHTADGNDAVTVCWTSGTEARPKAVPRSHHDWLAISWGSVDAPKLTADDVLLNPFPMVNMAGIAGMFLPWLLTGATLVQHHPFDLPTFLGQIAAERVTYTLAPPALLTLLLLKPEILAASDISSVRILGSGSAPLSTAMVRGWKDRHGIDVINYFGSNEGLSLVGDPETIPDPGERAQFFPRIGAGGYTWPNRATRGTRTRLVDLASGAEITEPGIPGELRIAGPTVFAGYLNGGLGGELDLSPFDEQGYFRTGDVFAIATGDDGDPRYYRYVDRSKDLVIRGGMNVSPAELEGLLATHPAVAEAAVVGYPDPVLGERICAVLVPRPEVDADVMLSLNAVREFLADEGVADYKLPERVEIMAALPRNPVGKILKRNLRESLHAEPR